MRRARRPHFSSSSTRRRGPCEDLVYREELRGVESRAADDEPVNIWERGVRRRVLGVDRARVDEPGVLLSWLRFPPHQTWSHRFAAPHDPPRETRNLRRIVIIIVIIARPTGTPRTPLRRPRRVRARAGAREHAASRRGCTTEGASARVTRRSTSLTSSAPSFFRSRCGLMVGVARRRGRGGHGRTLIPPKWSVMYDHSQPSRRWCPPRPLPCSLGGGAARLCDVLCAKCAPARRRALADRPHGLIPKIAARETR